MGNAQKKMDADVESSLDELPEGTELLHGQFKIIKFLNSGGFGMTYLANDGLDQKVVIKECFPSSVCNRSRTIVQARSRAHIAELRSVVNLFVQEARSLAKLDHPSIVGVHQVFQDNNTAYMALDYVEGRDLLDMIEAEDQSLTAPQIRGILKDILAAVSFIHSNDILHRDISPDNILVDDQLRPVLIDFGAACEEATKKSQGLSQMRVVKDGYSPQEFYIQGSHQSPASDLYSLGATFYHLISGELPTNSQSRLSAIATGEADPYKPLAGRIKGFDTKSLAAIDKALELLPKNRIQTADEWLEMLDGGLRKSRVLMQLLPVYSAAAEEAASEKRSKLMPILGAAAVLGLVAGGAYLYAAAGGTLQTSNVDAALQPAADVFVEVAVASKLAQRTELEPTQAGLATITTPVPAAVSEPALQTDLVTELPETSPSPVGQTVVDATPSNERLTAELAPENGSGDLSLLAEVALADPAPEASVEPAAPIETVPSIEVVNAQEFTIALPVEGVPRSNIAESAAVLAPIWAQPGDVVASVNLGVGSIESIADLLVGSALDAGVDSLDLSIESAFVSTYSGTVPVSYLTTLADGSVFATTLVDGAWETTVRVAGTSSGDFEVGDRPATYVSTGALLDPREALGEIISSEAEARVDTFNFVVDRAGSMWMASLNAAPETDD